ncbi:Hypothetical protein PMT_2734 [Prochlorococcus marinus str. MIT 9313]|uniref:Uncharacterized protein n=1 Tax=Prochlorococcus marinus (strain MIT 9313) TaxID=74547 RepID=B9ESB5_PROMM|nr:Hypothetical protein PMT_2734 [Prochlorococcus marinus str. MIT 9313]
MLCFHKKSFYWKVDFPKLPQTHLIAFGNTRIMIILFSSSILNGWQQCSLRL